MIYFHDFQLKCEILLQECEHGGVAELPKMLSDSQRICKVIVELIETERQYVRVSNLYLQSLFIYIVLQKVVQQTLGDNFVNS